MRSHSKCLCSSIRSLLLVCKTNFDNSKYVRINPITQKRAGIIERTYGSASRGLRGLTGVYISGVDACVDLLEINVWCNEMNGPKHECDASFKFFCWFCFVLLRLLSDDIISKQKITYKTTLYLAFYKKRKQKEEEKKEEEKSQKETKKRKKEIKKRKKETKEKERNETKRK